MNNFQQEERDYPYPKEKDWIHFMYEYPKEDKTILMKHDAFDIPPWTGYFDSGRYIAFETRLPIMVSHWKYAE